MVKSETRRDAEILVRNPSPRLFGEKFRYSKKVKTNHEKTRLRDLSKTFPRFRDRANIFRDPRFSRYHSPPLCLAGRDAQEVLYSGFVHTLRSDSKRLRFLPDICNADIQKTSFSAKTYTVLNGVLNGLQRKRVEALVKTIR